MHTFGRNINLNVELSQSLELFAYSANLKHSGKFVIAWIR
ncbi:hypothetical protein SpAn4DRAFT_0402 [Sporomusa ovata]|uniref:Uncharacterized protein n=1 Tax=Sporomusa ovata TaxID=2378 RepID=A0A0U1L2R1_9FIRM|nr:hypothetical protein SpAn4DRAFT_0402 [Sporomusa ovata]